MDNSINTPTIFELDDERHKQLNKIKTEYGNVNKNLRNKLIRDKKNQVFYVNNQSVATYFPNRNVYNYTTSTKRGIPGTGNLNSDAKNIIVSVPFTLNPRQIGYDTVSGLYLNGNIRPGQSGGDEGKNVFAGVKMPTEFNYIGCYDIQNGLKPINKKASLTKCYYDAVSRNKSLFGLGHVDDNTNMGECYGLNWTDLKKRWENPGQPIWMIDLNKELNFSKNKQQLRGLFIGLDSNIYFLLVNNKVSLTYSFANLYNLKKLPGWESYAENNFYSKTARSNQRMLFLSNGNLYYFSFPKDFPIPNDVKKDIINNPNNYNNYILYSTNLPKDDTSGSWSIASGAFGNILTDNKVLAVGKSIYSADGKLKLTLNSNNTLVLYKYKPNLVGCRKLMNSKRWIGNDGMAVNRILNVTRNQESHFGKLAYVNSVGTAHEFNDPSLLIYTNKYTSNPGFTLNNIEKSKDVTKIKDDTPFVNNLANRDRCNKKCNEQINPCVGTVIDNNSCYLLNKLNNNNVTYKDDANMSLRVPRPNTDKLDLYKPISIGSSTYYPYSTVLPDANDITTINSNKLANYTKSQMNKNTMSFSFIPKSVVQKVDESTKAVLNKARDISKNPTMNKEAFEGEVGKIGPYDSDTGYIGVARLYGNFNNELEKLSKTFTSYTSDNPPIKELSSNIYTLDKMVSDSQIHMRYMNIMYSILFIFVCILLIISFTISL